VRQNRRYVFHVSFFVKIFARSDFAQGDRQALQIFLTASIIYVTICLMMIKFFFSRAFAPNQCTRTAAWLLGSLALLIVLLPFNEGGNGYILQGVIQLWILSWATIWAIGVIRRGRLTLLLARIDAVVIGFLGWALLSLVFSDYTYATIVALLKIVSYAALFYLCRLLAPLRNARRLLLGAIVGSSLAQLGAAGYNHLLRGAPILQAGFVNPNKLACLFVVGLAILLSALLFASPATPRRRWYLYAGGTLAAGALLLGLLALRSRGALIGFAAVGLFLTTLRQKRLGLLFGLLLVGLLLVPIQGDSLLQRFRKADDPFAYQRLSIWTSTLRMIADHPVIGVGPGMYEFHSAPYNFPTPGRVARYGKRPKIAHSDILQIGAELGLPGMTLCLAGLGMLGLTALRQLRSRPLAWPVTAAAAILLAIVAQGLFSNLLLSPAIAMMGVLAGVILLDAANLFRRKPLNMPTFQRHPRQWHAALALACLYLLIPVIGYPFWGHWHFLRYQRLRQQRNLPRAVAHLQAALQWVPIHAYYHYEFGKLYQTAFRNQPNLDAFYEAYHALTQAIRYNPQDFRMYIRLAELHREMFRQMLPTPPTAHNAIAAYQQAIRLNPFDPFLRFSLATLYADFGQFEQAVETLQTAVALEPNFVGGHQMLSKLLTHLNRPEAAAAALQEARRIARQHPVSEQAPEYVQSLLRWLELG